MQLDLYITYSKYNALSKTLESSFHVTITTLRMKEGSSVDAPIVAVTLGSDAERRTALFRANYAVLSFGSSANVRARNYFITDRIMGLNNEVILHLKQDVLATFKALITASSGMVARSYNLGSKDLVDPLIPFTNKDVVNEYIPTDGTYVNTTFDLSSHISDNFVLSFVNSTQSGSPFSRPSWDANITPPVSGMGLPSILYGDNIYDYRDDFRVLSYSDVAGYLDYTLATNASVSTYIKSLISFPFSIPKKSTDHLSIVLGTTTCKNINGDTLLAYPPKHLIGDYYIIGDFTINRSSYFWYYEPYTKCEIYIPYCGWISLQPSKVFNKRLIVGYSVNFADGSAQAFIYDVSSSHGSLVYSGTCQLGNKIGLTSSNEQEINASRQAGALNMAMNLVASGVAIAGGAITQNPVATAMGVVSGSKAIAGEINAEAMRFEKGIAVFNGAVAGIFAPQKVRVRITSRGYVTSPITTANQVSSEVGTPLNEVESFSSLSGYAEISHVNFAMGNSTTLGVTLSELNEIKSLLREGVIFD